MEPFRLCRSFLFSLAIIVLLGGSANRTATLQATPDDRTSPSALGFTNVTPDDPAGVAPPVIYTSGFNIGPSPQGPTKLHDMVYQVQDHVTVTHGRHEWKFGADLHWIQDNFNYDYYTNGSFDFGLYGIGPISGTFTGSSLSDFVGGFPDNYYQSSNAVYGIRTPAVWDGSSSARSTLIRLAPASNCNNSRTLVT